MIQGGDGLGLTREALGELGLGCLNGDDAVEPRVARLPDFAHAACPDWRKYFVRPQPIARNKRHTVTQLVYQRSLLPSLVVSARRKTTGQNCTVFYLGRVVR